MDGVLLTSTPAVERVWRKWAVEHGRDPDYVARISHGRRSIETLAELDIPDTDLEAENIAVEGREIADTGGVLALNGACALLASLPPERRAIVTSATRPLAEVRLRVAGLPVPRDMITAEIVTRGKPDPEPYLKGAALLGVDPIECVVIEDVPPGIASAHAAGMRVIALTTTISPAELAQADWIAHTCADIRADVHHGEIMLTINCLR